MSTARATGWGRRAYTLPQWDELERLRHENHHLRHTVGMLTEELQIMQEVLQEAHDELGTQER